VNLGALLLLGALVEKQQQKKQCVGVRAHLRYQRWDGKDRAKDLSQWRDSTFFASNTRCCSSSALRFLASSCILFFSFSSRAWRSRFCASSAALRSSSSFSRLAAASAALR